MELEASHIPSATQAQAEVSESERVTFTRVDGPFNRDAVRFANGKVITLQALGAGVTAWLAAAPDSAQARTGSGRIRSCKCHGTRAPAIFGEKRSCRQHLG